jgi:glycosyltransferase involved in cell wall biosynthesis
VHTEKMKSELEQDFGVKPGNITVLTHPINDAFPDTNLTPVEAKRQLGVGNGEKTVLFFGRIRPYKGLEYLVEAFQQIVATDGDYRLIIAGEHKKGSEEYSARIEALIKDGVQSGVIIPRMNFIPDEEAEVYLKGADLLALPYKEIFQSGVLFLSYSFGLPVVATQVGSFDEGVIEGKTGFVCKACDSASLAAAIQKYFASDLYRNLATKRKEIRDYTYAEHSWEAVARLSVQAYAGHQS